MAAVGVDVVIASVVEYTVGSPEKEELINIVQTAEHMHISVDASIESGVLANMRLYPCASNPKIQIYNVCVCVCARVRVCDMCVHVCVTSIQ